MTTTITRELLRQHNACYTDEHWRIAILTAAIRAAVVAREAP